MTGVQETFRPDPIQRAEALRARAQRFQAEATTRFEALQAQIADDVPPNPVHASVKVDERGYPVAVELTGHTSAVAGDDVRSALTAAFLSARSPRQTLPPDALEPLMSLLRAAAADPQGAPERIAEAGETVWNDLGQAGATALFGDVTAVHARDEWISRTPSADISAEILALAQRAATASDRFGRFGEKEENGG